MSFTFSVRTALKKSWNLFAARPQFFMVLAFVMVVFSAFSDSKKGGDPLNIALTALVVIASILWSYVWISVSLAAVDGRNDVLNLRSISKHMPSVRQFFALIGVGICVGIVVILGFVLLIIPGIYLLVRLSFSNTALVDREQGVVASMKYSWGLVKGKIFWTVLIVFFVQLMLFVVGTIPFMIGLLITYPIGMLLMTTLYRDLTVFHRNLSEPVREIE